MSAQLPLNQGTLDAQLLDLFLFLGSQWILYLLLFLSVVSIAITVERLVYFARQNANLVDLAALLSERLAADDVTGARQTVEQARTAAAPIVVAGLAALPRGAGAVEEMMQAATQVERLKMERGLAFLGTLGNNAPFVGLFGTVLGIIRSFRDLSAQVTDTSSVMSGIAEALVATAVGLLVALPAVAVFNAFQRRIKRDLVMTETLTRQVLAHAKTERR